MTAMKRESTSKAVCLIEKTKKKLTKKLFGKYLKQQLAEI